MERNVGGLDRSSRLLVGIILAIAGIAALAGYWNVGAVVGVVALIVAAILLGTGAIQKCPINEAAGIDTTE